MIVSAVCTSNFFQAIFLHVVWVLFITFGTCLLSSTCLNFDWIRTILFIVPKSCKRDYIYCFLWWWFPTKIASRTFSIKLTGTSISNAFSEKISCNFVFCVKNWYLKVHFVLTFMLSSNRNCIKEFLYENISSTKLYFIETKDICTTHNKESDIYFRLFNIYFVSFILTIHSSQFILWPSPGVMSIWKGIVMWGNSKSLLTQSKQQVLY